MTSESDRAAVERALMDRARASATRQVESPPRNWLQHLVAMVLALAIVAVVLVGFDKFLTSMQKFLETEVVEPAPAATDPMPAYIVPATPADATTEPGGGTVGQPGG